jgi:hypothetical protein
VSEIGFPFSNLKGDVKAFKIYADKSGGYAGRIFVHIRVNAFHSKKDSHETILSKQNRSLRAALLFSFCAVAPFSSLPDLSHLG